MLDIFQKAESFEETVESERNMRLAVASLIPAPSYWNFVKQPIYPFLKGNGND
jgi:hypothetical protein